MAKLNFEIKIDTSEVEKAVKKIQDGIEDLGKADIKVVDKPKVNHWKWILPVFEGLFFGAAGVFFAGLFSVQKLAYALIAVSLGITICLIHTFIQMKAKSIAQKSK